MTNLQLLHNNGLWSVAELNWQGKPALGLRWNGSDTENGVGSPNSRGIPTWFIIPNELKDAIKNSLPKQSEIELAYSAMAVDEVRETEALDWCNSLIGDNNATG